VMLDVLRDFWNSPARMNRATGMLVGSSILVALAAGGVWMAQRQVFAIERVVVDAARGELRHVSAAEVHAAIAEVLNGTVLSADLDPVHRSVQSIPWVRRATVRRVWPNRLLVRIEEHRAVAMWTDGRLVNDVGEIFPGQAADHEDPCLLLPIAGPAGSQRLVLERARQLSEWLSPLNRPLQTLTLSEQYAWTAKLAGGLVLELGRDTLATPLEERVRMFVRTQSWLGRRLAASGESGGLVRADLRYATGYAFQTASVAPDQTAPLSSAPLCIRPQA
jgi:cell division protein FtsQ